MPNDRTDRYDRADSLCDAGGADLSRPQVRAGHAIVWCYYVRRNLPAMLGGVPEGRGRGKARAARDLGEAVQTVAGAAVLHDEGAHTGAETWERISALCEEWERADSKPREVN